MGGVCGRVGESVCGEWVRECMGSGWDQGCVGEWVRERLGSTFYNYVKGNMVSSFVWIG